MCGVSSSKCTTAVNIFSFPIPLYSVINLKHSLKYLFVSFLPIPLKNVLSEVNITSQT